MTIPYKASITALVAALMILTLNGCDLRGAVSFSSDVMPILKSNCLECHKAGGSGYESSGFSMESYADLMKGTRNGLMVISGDSIGSNLVVLMEGRADPSISMPHGYRQPMASEDIETIKRWIDQGAKDN